MDIPQGLEVSRDMGVQMLLVQMDDSVCIGILCLNIIVPENWIVEFKHCYLDGNRASDRVAK